MSRLKLICSLLFVMGAIFLLYGSTGQMRNMAKARQHIPLVTQAIAPHREFRSVRSGVATGGGGVLVLEGTVSSRDDLDILQRVVSATSPPVKVRYAVRVVAERAAQKRRL